MMLPGWYGAATAFDALGAATTRTRPALLATMHERWPFFRA